MTIILPKYRGIPDPQRPINGGHTGYSGQGKVILRDINGKKLYESPWESNLITDNGLNIIGKGPFVLTYRTYIGSSSTPADDLDVDMGPSFLAQSSTVGGGASFQLGTAPDWEYYADSSRRFAAGVGTGTVAEIALGQSSNSTGDNMFNRVVLGAPVVKGIDQILDVIFRITVWPPVIDKIGVSTIEGVAYNTITRGRNYPNWTGAGLPSNDYVRFKTSTAASIAYPNNIGVITDDPQPGGDDLSGGGSVAVSTYVDDDLFKTMTCSPSLDQWIVTNNLIRSIGVGVEQFLWQTQFDSQVNPGFGIPKDDTEIMDLTVKVSWGRKP